MALVGNPNAGKTTLFNELTGETAYVGNWPGVTVEKKEGKLQKDPEGTLVDLPGIYSLSPYTLEEVIARDYLIEEKPDIIINIVDASNLERNLYLTTQLLELGLPMLVAANKTDVVNSKGDLLDSEKLSEELGLPVVEISAKRGEGIDDLLEEAKRLLQSGEKPDFKLDYGEDIESILGNIDQSLNPYQKLSVDKRWYDIKLFEKDQEVLEEFSLSEELIEQINEIEELKANDSQSLISEKRYDYIDESLESLYTRRPEQGLSLSDKIDKILTNKWLGIPIFILIIFFVYYISIATVGTYASDFVNEVLIADWAQGGAYRLLTSLGVSDWLVNLIVEGIIAGVGAVLGFLPQMAVLFVFLALLEQSGYMSRVAFILDRVFSSFGLSGKSFIPMLVGTGCSVPAIMATRTIENESQRKATIITTSFMPCSAKLPIIAFFAGALFDGRWWFAPLCYFIGIAAIIVSGIILKKMRAFASDPTPFIMEFPDYHLPSLKSILRDVGEKVWSFIQKAGTIILVSSIILWFLQAYGWSSSQGIVAVGENMDQSFLARIASLVSWIFIPTGFGDWQSTVATVSGFVAKENILSSFAILFGVGGDAVGLVEAGEFSALSPITAHYTPLSAFSFLVFNLLCMPCFAAVGATHKELGDGKWTIFAIAYQMIFAYAISLMVYQFGRIILGGSINIWTILAGLVLVIGLYLVFRPAQRRQKESGKALKDLN